MLEILDTDPEHEFDTIARTAQRLLGATFALVAFVDDSRQWFKAKAGIDAIATPRPLGFCAHAVETDDILVVEDATQDPRFAASPLVTGAPFVRFYAGVPIRARRLDGGAPRFPVGTVCVVDDRPRAADPAEIAILEDLARLAEALLEARMAARVAARFAEEQRLTLEELDRLHRQFSQAERLANVGSWRLNLADRRTEWSRQTYAIHGVPASDSEALERALSFYPNHAREVIATAIERTIATGAPYDVDVDFLNAQGQCRRVRCLGELEIRGGVPVSLIGVIQDVTERYLMEQALREIAYTDELTRLSSRSAFNAYLDQKVAAAREGGAALAVLLLDLDHFKIVNDRCGHAAGDAVLQLMSARLQVGYLEDSYAARLGGDEFVLVVSSQPLLADLPGLITRLLADLRHAVPSADGPITVSATIGACWLAPDCGSRTELLQKADAALYRAKQFRRGTACVSGREEPIVAAPARAWDALRLVG